MTWLHCVQPSVASLSGRVVALRLVYLRISPGARTLGRCRAAERAMHALLVVIVAEYFRRARQVERVPEKHLIEDLAPDRANQPFDGRMRDRDVGHRFYFLDVEYPQVGKPAVKPKQGIVVGTEVFRQRLSGHGTVKHSAYAHAVNGCRSHAEAD